MRTDLHSVETLPDLLPLWLARDEAPAVIATRSGTTEVLTYACLAEDAHALAAALGEMGLRQGGRVVIWGPNSPDWIIAYFAIVTAGGCAVPLDATLDDAGLGRAIERTGAGYIFTTGDLLLRIRDIGNGAITPIRLDHAGPGKPAVPSWRDLAAGRAFDPPHVTPADRASLLFTSGTTGEPKAVPLAHANFVANMRALGEARLVGPADRVALPLPLHHAYPFTVGVLGSLSAGAALVLSAGTSGPELAQALRQGEATVLIGVPRLYEGLIGAIEARVAARGRRVLGVYRRALAISGLVRRALGIRSGRLLFRGLRDRLAPSLRLLASGGARLEPEDAWKLEALGFEVLTGYGLTETSPILTFNRRGESRIGSAGRPVGGVEIRITGPSQEGEGEIQARGASVFSGYLDDPEAANDAFTADGWFRTGDLGRIDGDGFLFVTGRIKEVIVLPDGKKVLPEPIEDLLAQSPFIEEAALVMEVGRLVALLKPDYDAIRRHGAARAAELLRDEVQALSMRLPSFQRVAGYRLVRAPLPRTPLGKIQRHLLSALYARAERGPGPAAKAARTPEDAALLRHPVAARIWAWLETRFPETPLDLDTCPQLDLGIDSLGWVAITLEIHDGFGVSLSEEALARIVTLRDLLTEIVRASEGTQKESAAAGEAERWLRPPGLLLAALGRALHVVDRLVFMRLFRLRIEGAANPPWGRAFVLAPNHVSFLDAFAVAAALPWRHLRRLYWAGWTGILFSSPVRRLFSRAARVLPTDPDRGPGRALALGAETLGRGRALAWFPEGRRSADGCLGPFQAGIGHLLAETRVPVVPVLIAGTYDAWPLGRRFPRLHPVRVTFGVPLEPEGFEGLSADRITETLREALLAMQSGGQDGSSSTGASASGTSRTP